MSAVAEVLPRTNVIEYQTPGPEIRADANTLLVSVNEMVIDSHDMKVYAVDELKGIKGKANALEEKRTTITGPLNRALKAVNDLFRDPAAVLAQAERLLKGKIDAYDQKVEAERRAEEARLADIARKEQERLTKKAEAAAAAGKVAQAEELREQAAAAPLAVVLPDEPKVSGLSGREDWDFEITNAALVPDLYKTVDEKKIRGVVKALKGAANIPGVRVFSKTVLAVRA